MTGPNHELITEIHLLLDSIDTISVLLNQAERLLVEEKYNELKDRIGESLIYEFADMRSLMSNVIDDLNDHF